MKRVFDRDCFVLPTLEEDTASEYFSETSSSDSMFDLSDESNPRPRIRSSTIPPKLNVSRPHGINHLYFGEGSSDEWSKGQNRNPECPCGIGPKSVAMYIEQQRRFLAEQELLEFSDIRFDSSEAWLQSQRRARQARSAAMIDQRLRFAMRYGIRDVEDETPDEWYESRNRERINKYGTVPFAADGNEQRRLWGLHNMFNVHGVHLETLDEWYARVDYDHAHDPNLSSVWDLEGVKDAPAKAVNTKSVFNAKRKVNSSICQVGEKKGASTDVKGMRVASSTQEYKFAMLSLLFSKLCQGSPASIAFMDELREAMWQKLNVEKEDGPHAFRPENIGLYEAPSADVGLEKYLAKVASLLEGMDLMRDTAEDPEHVASTSAETSGCRIDPDMDLTEKYKDYDARLEAHDELMLIRRASPYRRLDEGEIVDWYEMRGGDPTEVVSKVSDEELLDGREICYRNVVGVQGTGGGKEDADRDKKRGLIWYVMCGVDPTEVVSETSDEELLDGQEICYRNVVGVQIAEGGK